MSDNEKASPTSVAADDSRYNDDNECEGQGDDPDQEDQDVHYTQTAIYAAFSPLLTSLKIGGMFYENHDKKASSV